VWGASITDLTTWTQETLLSGIEVVRQLIFADNGNGYFITGTGATEGDVYIVVGEDFANPTQVGLDTSTLVYIDCFGPAMATTDKDKIYLSYDYFVSYAEIDITNVSNNGSFGFSSTGRLLYEFNDGSVDANTTLNYLDVGFMKSCCKQTVVKKLIAPNAKIFNPSVSMTSSFTATQAGHYFIDCTAGNVVVTLPTTGKDFNIKFFKTDSSLNTITFSENVNGDSAFTISSQYSSVPLFFDGSNYYVE